MNTFLVTYNNGRDQATVTAHSWTIVDGSLVFLDERDNRLQALAPRLWLQVVNT